MFTVFPRVTDLTRDKRSTTDSALIVHRIKVWSGCNRIYSTI